MNLRIELAKAMSAAAIRLDMEGNQPGESDWSYMNRCTTGHLNASIAWLGLSRRECIYEMLVAHNFAVRMDAPTQNAALWVEKLGWEAAP